MGAKQSSVEKYYGVKLKKDWKKKEITLKEHALETVPDDDNVSEPTPCDYCVRNSNPYSVGTHLCLTCETYMCETCRTCQHQCFHMDNEGDRKQASKNLFEEIKQESERRLKIKEEKVSICDYLKVGHKPDKMSCMNFGICGLDDERIWAITDTNNASLKLFKLGSRRIQRYIQFTAEPADVTEVKVEETSQEIQPVLVDTSDSKGETAVPEKQCYLAVSFPWCCQISILNITPSPCIIFRTLKTKQGCFTIRFFDGKLFVVCMDSGNKLTWSVRILTMEGKKTKHINLPSHIYDPHMAVSPAGILVTDWKSSHLILLDHSGKRKSKFELAGGKPEWVAIDKDENVYLSVTQHDMVYKLSTDLQECQPLLDQTFKNMLHKPWSIRFHQNLLFVGHAPSSGKSNYITIIRLL